MRTTLDLDPAVIEAARAIAFQNRKSLGAVVSELALKALTAKSTRRKRAKFPVFSVPPDEPAINLATVRKLIDDEGLPS